MKESERIVTFLLFYVLFSISVKAFDDTASGCEFLVTSQELQTAEVCGYKYPEQTNAEVVIPSSVNYNGKTYTVTSIGNRAFADNYFRKITIPKSIVSIGDYAFYSHNNLWCKVIIPNSVKRIGECAFYDCSKMGEGIVLPESVEYIGDNAFSNCSTSITLNQSNSNFIYKDGILYDKDYTHIFYSNKFLEGDIVLPSSVRKIDDCAFFKRQGITSVRFSEGVEILGSHIFGDCTGLKSVYLPSSIKSIDSSFSGCSNLSHIECLAQNPPTLSLPPFYEVSKNAIVVVPQNSSSSYYADSGWCYFNIINEEGIHPNNQIWYTTTDMSPINYSGAISDIYYDGIGGIMRFNGDVTRIEKDIFSGKTNVSSIAIPGSVSQIDENAFSGCTSLTSFSFVDGTDALELYYKQSRFCNDDEDSPYDKVISFFTGCPVSNLYIGRDFYTNYSGSYTIGDDCTDGWDNWAGPMALGNLLGTVKNIEIGANVKNVNYLSLFSNLSDVKINEENDNLCVDGYGIYNKDKTVLHSYFGGGDFVIPNSVCSIADSAFYNNQKIQTLIVPSSVKEIGYSTFYGTKGRATFNCNIPNGKYFDNIKTGEWTYAYSGYRGFWGCLSNAAFTEVEFGDNVRRIGYYAFYDNNNIKSLVIPYDVELGSTTKFEKVNFKLKNLEELEKDAPLQPDYYNVAEYYYDGNLLTDITLPNSISKLGQYALCNVVSLESVTIPENVTQLSYKSLSNCRNLKDVYCYAPTAPAIKSYALSSNPSTLRIHVSAGYADIYKQANVWKNYTIVDDILPSINLNDGDTFTDESGFAFKVLSSENKYVEVTGYADKESVEALDIPSTVKYGGNTYTVTRIGDSAFRDGSFSTVSIPNTVSSIGNRAFYWCRNLSSVIIPNGVEKIDNWTFDYNTSLASVSLPASVTSIGMGVFSNCYSLSTISLPENIANIEYQAFANCTSLETVYIPASVTKIGGQIFKGCTKLSSVNVDSSNTILSSENGVLFNKDRTELLLCPALITGEYIVPSSVTRIVEYVFANSKSLSSVRISENVADFHGYAFDECPVPAINVDESNVNFSSVDGVLYNKDKSKVIRYPEGKTGDYVILEGVKTIGEHAFYRCSNLSSLTIPEDVTSIERFGIYWCRTLKNVCVNCTTPPVLGSYNFNSCSSDLTIKIPNNCVDLYKQADGWMDLTIEGITDDFDIANIPIVDSTIPEWQYGEIPSQVEDVHFRAYCNDYYGEGFDPEEVTEFCSISDNPEVEIIDLRKFTNLKYLGPGHFIHYNEFVKAIYLPPYLEEIGLWGMINNGQKRGSGASVVGEFKIEGFVFPATLKRLGSQAIWNTVKYLSFKSVTPPRLDDMSRATNSIFDATAKGLQELRERNFKIYVPAESVEAYATAEGWNYFREFLVGVREVPVEDEEDESETDISKLTNALYLSDLTASPGSTATLSLNMKNAVQTLGYQVDIYLPTGMSFATDEDGLYTTYLSTERTTSAKTNYFDAIVQPDGALRILCSSTKGYAFSGSDGEVATIGINIEDNVKDGTYPILLKNIEMSDMDANPYKVPMIQSSIEIVSFKTGDVNGDDNVTVSDFTATANYILGNTPTIFNPKAADVNGDKNISVSDLTGMANIILYGNTSGLLAKVRTKTIGNVTVELPSSHICPGTEITVPVLINNNVNAFSAFQMDMHLPEGISVNNISLAKERATSKHALGTAYMKDGSFRILAYSTSNRNFDGADGAVVYITLVADKSLADGEYTIDIDGIELSESGHSIKPSNVSVPLFVTGPTAIDNVNSGTMQTEMYDMSGRKLNTSANRIPAGMYIINGKKVSVK